MNELGCKARCKQCGAEFIVNAYFFDWQVYDLKGFKLSMQASREIVCPVCVSGELEVSDDVLAITSEGQVILVTEHKSNNFILN